ncbi:hypothetical protein [Sorangium sp. So ce590]|uniref:hypothetical protein n=1 Tax=unclassified Sorangium TaxID=2621164 RepID=UPI003F6187AD
MRLDKEALQIADASSVSFSLGSARTVSGTVRTPDGTAEFSGKYVLMCWVPPNSLGKAENGTGSGGVERLQDGDFESPFCKQVAHLR